MGYCPLKTTSVKYFFALRCYGRYGGSSQILLNAKTFTKTVCGVGTKILDLPLNVAVVDAELQNLMQLWLMPCSSS